MMPQFKEIDLTSWPREKYFRFFSDFQEPSYSMTVKVDVSDLFKYHKEKKNLSSALLYGATCAANAVSEFKQRIREEKIIEWEHVGPSLTVSTPKNLFNFCYIPFHRSFVDFNEIYQEKIAKAKIRESLFDPEEGEEEGADHSLFVSMIPWCHFESMTHPVYKRPVDSVPRLAIGKCKENYPGKIELPINVQVNHRLIDGVHLGTFFQKCEEFLRTPFV